MTDTIDPPRWWDDPENVAELAHWLADNHYTAKDVAYAVEKPWKFQDEYGDCLGVRRREEADAERRFAIINQEAPDA